jgi:uroporphyrinogen decarboxylase
MDLVNKILEYGKIDMIVFGDDMGTQKKLFISPKIFQDFIFPAYQKIFKKIRSRGIHVYLHTDGHVSEIFDQLIKSGVDILNIQESVHDLKDIVLKCKKIVCVSLDLDYQNKIPFGTPDIIKQYIEKVVKSLSLRSGGLILSAEIHPPTPIINVKALAKSMKSHMWLN